MLSSCDWFQADKNKDIKIGIIADDSKEKYLSLIRGAELAVNDINAKGGLLGRKITLIPKNDKADINEGLVIASSFSKMDGVLAVIGHKKSYVTLHTSNVYESANIIMLTPGATRDVPTEKKRNYIFRMIPNSKIIGSRLAQYSNSQQFKNVILFYIRNDYDQNLATSFENEASRLGINVVERRSYIEEVADYSRLFDYWKRNFKFDSILLTGTDTDEAAIINQIRQAGINVPIIIGDTMSASDLVNIAGKNAEGIVSIDFADDEHFDTQAGQLFRTTYFKNHAKQPDPNALLGYDAIMLLANAVTKTQSLSNATIAAYLHQNAYEGLVTKYQFDENGNNLSFTKPFFKKIKNGVFVLFDGPMDKL
jgi:branched-chain amino acid transport system substrate-binding protein